MVWILSANFSLSVYKDCIISASFSFLTVIKPFLYKYNIKNKGEPHDHTHTKIYRVTPVTLAEFHPESILNKKKVVKFLNGDSVYHYLRFACNFLIYLFIKWTYPHYSVQKIVVGVIIIFIGQQVLQLEAWGNVKSCRVNKVPTQFHSGSSSDTNKYTKSNKNNSVYGKGLRRT